MIMELVMNPRSELAFRLQVVLANLENLRHLDPALLGDVLDCLQRLQQIIETLISIALQESN